MSFQRAIVFQRMVEQDEVCAEQYLQSLELDIQTCILLTVNKKDAKSNELIYIVASRTADRVISSLYLRYLWLFGLLSAEASNRWPLQGDILSCMVDINPSSEPSLPSEDAIRDALKTGVGGITEMLESYSLLNDYQLVNADVQGVDKKEEVTIATPQEIIDSTTQRQMQETDPAFWLSEVVGGPALKLRRYLVGQVGLIDNFSDYLRYLIAMSCYTHGTVPSDFKGAYQRSASEALRNLAQLGDAAMKLALVDAMHQVNDVAVIQTRVGAVLSNVSLQTYAKGCDVTQFVKIPADTTLQSRVGSEIIQVFAGLCYEHEKVHGVKKYLSFLGITSDIM